jgi:hypothetical protein
VAEYLLLFDELAKRAHHGDAAKALINKAESYFS